MIESPLLSCSFLNLSHEKKQGKQKNARVPLLDEILDLLKRVIGDFFIVQIDQPIALFNARMLSGGARVHLVEVNNLSMPAQVHAI